MPNNRMHEHTENKEAREKYHKLMFGNPPIPSFPSSNVWFK